MILRVRVMGARRIVRELDAWGEAFPRALEAALYEEGQGWADVSYSMTPEKTGRLRGSLFVSKPRGAGLRSYVEVGYGADYAVAVHNAPKTASGIPGFLQKTMEELGGGYLERVAQSTRAYAMARGGPVGGGGGGTGTGRDSLGRFTGTGPIANVDARWPTRPSRSGGSANEGGEGLRRRRFTK